MRLVEALEDLDDVQNVFAQLRHPATTSWSPSTPEPGASLSYAGCGPASVSVVRTRVRTRGCCMRVLGIDPGLTRCGLGVVEGSVGRPLSMVEVGVVRTPPDAADLAERLLRDRRAASRRGSTGTAPTPSRSSGSSASTTSARSWAPPRSAGSRCWSRPAGGHPGRAAHAQRGEGGGHRQRPRRQGPGRRDGHPAAPARRTPQARRRRRRAALAICHIWRGGAQARIDAAMAATGRTTR